MKEQRRQIVILAVAAAVLLGVYGVINLWTSSLLQQEESEEPVLALTSQQDLNALEIETKQQTLKFVQNDSGWSLSDDPAYPLDQNQISTVISSWKNLTAQRRLDQPDTLSDYGLDEPAMTIRGEDVDGNVTVIRFSELQQDSLRYAMKEGDDTVYVMSGSAADSFDLNLDELIALEYLPSIVRSDIQSVSIQNGDQVLLVTRMENDSEERWLVSDNLSSVESGSDPLSSFFSTLTTLTPQSCLSYTGEEAVAAQYELDSPVTTLTVQYTQDNQTHQLTLELGKVLDEDETLQAVRLQGSSMIQTMKTDNLNRILELSVEQVSQAQQESESTADSEIEGS